MRARGIIGAIMVGALIGVALELLTVALARWGPTGEGWSLRGNGALLVPFGLGPAALAGGWSALIRRGRGDARWLVWGSGAALGGAALVGVGLLALILGGSAGQSLAGVFSFAPLLWLVIAPLVAALAPVHGPAGARRPLAHLAGGALYGGALLAGFIAASRLIAPG